VDVDCDSFRFHSAAPSPGDATVAAQVVWAVRDWENFQQHQDVLWRQRAAIPWEPHQRRALQISTRGSIPNGLFRGNR
jgi:arginine utilization protein RocB